MLRNFLRLGFLLLVASWGFAQRPSELVGTWMGKVRGYDVEMHLILNADGSAEYEGVMGTWRAQGNKLFLSEEGETVRYNFQLQGAQLTLSGGDLMGELALRRLGGAAPMPPHAASSPSTLPERAAPQLAPTKASRAGLSETEIAKLLAAGVATRRLVDLVGEHGIAFSPTPAALSRLKAKGAQAPLLDALQRAGGKQAGMPSAPSRVQGATSRPTGGSHYTHTRWGLSLAVPPRWKVGERSQALLLASDTEPGLMIVRFMRRTTVQTLAAGYGEGLQEEGLQLTPTRRLESFSAGGAQGLAGELAGTAQDGARIQARVIAVPTPYGDAAVVVGLTTQEKYQGLKPRVDALAASLSFTRPQAPAVPGFLAGQYFYISTSSFGSSERYLNLCSDGRFSERRDIYSTGQAGTAYGEAGESAHWSAEGNANQGTVTVTYPNGKTSQFGYRRSGGYLVVGGRKYARYGDGSCTKTSVY